MTIHLANVTSTVTRFGNAIVEIIAMSKSKASEPLQRYPKKINSSTDVVYYQSASSPRIRKVSHIMIGKWPIYKFFIDHNQQYFPLRCMLDLGSTFFLISPEAAKAFSIPVVKRIKPIQTKDVLGKEISTKGLFTVPLGLSVGNHRSFDDEDHASEVLNISADYDAVIPAWY